VKRIAPDDIADADQKLKQDGDWISFTMRLCGMDDISGDAMIRGSIHFRPCRRGGLRKQATLRLNCPLRATLLVPDAGKLGVKINIDAWGAHRRPPSLSSRLSQITAYLGRSLISRESTSRSCAVETSSRRRRQLGCSSAARPCVRNS